jgi:hypothetical protein
MRIGLRVLSISAIVVMGVGLGLFFGFGSQNNVTLGAGALVMGAGALLAIAAFVAGVVAAARRHETGWLVGFIVAAAASVPIFVLGPIVVGVVGLVYSFLMKAG